MSTSRNPRRLAAALVLACMAAPATGALAPPDAATLDVQREARVAAVGYRLARAAAGQCDAPEPLPGMVIHDIASYAPADRAAIRQAYRLGDGFGVRLVVPGGAADRAGIRAGDEIVAIDGRELGGFAREAIGASGSPARTDRFLTLLRDSAAAGPVALRLRRDDAIVAARLVTDTGCSGRFVVAPGRAIDAWSDGTGVAVSAALVDLAASDDELAFVVAHEMAHNLRHDADRIDRASLAALGIGAGPTKAAEIAADRLAVRLMATAGFDPHAGETLLARVDARRGPALATTHPGLRRRIALLRRAIADLPGAP